MGGMKPGLPDLSGLRILSASANLLVVQVVPAAPGNGMPSLLSRSLSYVKTTGERSEGSIQILLSQVTCANDPPNMSLLPKFGSGDRNGSTLSNLGWRSGVTPLTGASTQSYFPRAWPRKSVVPRYLS